MKLSSSIAINVVLGFALLGVTAMFLGEPK